jgi:hypothetical protein
MFRISVFINFFKKIAQNEFHFSFLNYFELFWIILIEMISFILFYRNFDSRFHISKNIIFLNKNEFLKFLIFYLVSNIQMGSWNIQNFWIYLQYFTQFRHMAESSKSELVLHKSFKTGVGKTCSLDRICSRSTAFSLWQLIWCFFFASCRY